MRHQDQKATFVHVPAAKLRGYCLSIYHDNQLWKSGKYSHSASGEAGIAALYPVIAVEQRADNQRVLDPSKERHGD